MYTFFVILIVVASLLMIGIVLIQESKGGGLSSNFSSTNSIMGVRKTTDFVEKATWGLAAFMVVISIVCAYTAPQTRACLSRLLQRARLPTPPTHRASRLASRLPHKPLLRVLPLLLRVLRVLPQHLLLRQNKRKMQKSKG